MSDKQKFRFVEKPKAKGSRTSIVLAVISLAMMLGAFVFSFLNQGNGSTLLGAVGLCAFGFALYGFILGLLGLGQKKVDHKPAFIGALACGFIGIMWMAIFFVGIK